MSLIINCFKNFRRKRRCRVKKEEQPGEDPPSPNPRTAAGKSPGMASAMEQQPVVPLGEDTVSFGRHCKVLQTEYKKASRNGQVVVDLMDRTFAFRRQDILSHTYDLSELFDKYHFLQDCEQVCMAA